MVKYIIEGGINFYEELYKSLDKDEAITNGTTETNENNKDPILNVCQITGLPLETDYVTLECSHKFNYGALYTEICTQKYIFKSYNVSSLTNSDFKKFTESGNNYYIKCPYCRSIQFTLLPSCPYNKYQPKYGINTLEKTKDDENFLIKIPQELNHTYTVYGFTFQKHQGICCNSVIGMKNNTPMYCQHPYTNLVLEMNKSFCSIHIRGEIGKHKKKMKELERFQKKEKRIMDKVEKKEKLMKEREEKEKIRTQLKQEKLEQKNKIKKFIKNTVVNQTINIGEFNEPVESLEQVQLVTKCPAILKSGAKKGEQCGSNIKHNGFCLRHCVIIKE
jgi:hypothetical protein